MNERNEKTAEFEDQPFVTKAKEVFDQSVQGLDAETQSRLNRGRHEALAHAGRGVSHGQWLRWAPATGVAAAAVVAVVILTGRPPVDELLAGASMLTSLVEGVLAGNVPADDDISRFLRQARLAAAKN